MADAYDFWAERLPGEQQAAVGAFWAAFERQAAFLDAVFTGKDRSSGGEEVGACMNAALGPLADEIYWEFGPGEATGEDEAGEAGHFLALTPELFHSKRPLARALLRAAPEMPGWRFGDARRAQGTHDHLLAAVATRAFREVTLTGAEVQAGPHRTIDVLGHGPEEDAGGQAGLLFSLIVGEAAERDWLGEIATVVGSGARRRGLSGLFSRRPAVDETWVPAFAEAAEAMLEAMRADRTPGPFAPPRAEAERALFQLAPEDGSWPRADIVTYVTTRPDYAEARFGGVPLSAARFSTEGESFIGLRLARSSAAPFEEVTEREALADAIDADLRTAALGGVFGEAHGSAHVYVDAAVTDLPRAIATIERVLGQRALHAPAHILFDEAGLTDLALPLASHQPIH
ncbi:MAG: hypothetical protein AAF371_07400 [Pseudomonadota bacterium]